jgi:hypothetical protein
MDISDGGPWRVVQGRALSILCACYGRRRDGGACQRAVLHGQQNGTQGRRRAGVIAEWSVEQAQPWFPGGRRNG